jgi:transcriptional regulator with XRE-family HTH domain
VSEASSQLSVLIREMISKSGLTHSELGRRLGLSPSALSKVVQGKRHPARDTIIALGYECGCDRHELDKLLRIAGYPALMGGGPASLPIPQKG